MYLLILLLVHGEAGAPEFVSRFTRKSKNNKVLFWTDKDRPTKSYFNNKINSMDNILFFSFAIVVLSV